MKAKVDNLLMKNYGKIIDVVEEKKY